MSDDKTNVCDGDWKPETGLWGRGVCGLCMVRSEGGGLAWLLPDTHNLPAILKAVASGAHYFHINLIDFSAAAI